MPNKSLDQGGGSVFRIKRGAAEGREIATPGQLKRYASSLMNDEIVVRFASWADGILENHDISPIVAYNFNLYEHTEETAVQLIGATSFDQANDDWACDAYLSSGEDLFKLPHSVTGQNWQDAQRFVIRLVESYLQRRTLPMSVRTCRAVTVGFVDGSLEIVYLRRDA